MSRNRVFARCGRSSGSAASQTGLLITALLVSGCSADITRFDSPLFGLNDEPSSTGSLAGAQGPSNLSDQTPGSSGPGWQPPPRGGSDMRIAALPPPPDQPPADAPLRSASASPARVPSAPPAAAAPVQPARVAAARAPAPQGGETIEVHSGDTLFGLARKNNVNVEDLKRANNLTSTMLRPGQRLVLPARSARAETAAAARRVAAPAPTKTEAQPAQNATSNVAADVPGTYTLRHGDSLYSVSKAQKVSVPELQRLNNITDPAKLRVGTVLKLRADAGARAPSAEPAPSAPVRIALGPTVPPAPPAATNSSASSGTTTDAAPGSSPLRPTIINGPAPTPSLSDAARAQGGGLSPAPEATNTGTSAPATPLAFRWPATGRVISKFGPRADGGPPNDGIDIAVPLGAEVVAAEAGVVSYAGSELKGFGNLVLIRHEGGWVSAYAHNDELIVKRGDKVRRGQPIAKAGKSGNVDQPMVHFEIRQQDSKPLDPLPFIEK